MSTSVAPAHRLQTISQRMRDVTPPVAGLAAGGGEMRTLRGIVRRTGRARHDASPPSERIAEMRRATDPHPPVRGIRAGAGRARTLGGERDYRALMELVRGGTRTRDLSRLLRTGKTLQRAPVRPTDMMRAPVLPRANRPLDIAGAAAWISATSAAADPTHAASLAVHLCDCAVQPPGSVPIGSPAAAAAATTTRRPRASAPVYSTADKIDTIAQLAEGLSRLGELGARAARGAAGVVERRSKEGGRAQRVARRVREALGGAEDVAAATRGAAGVVRQERNTLARGIDRSVGATRKRASAPAAGAYYGAGGEPFVHSDVDSEDDDDDGSDTDDWVDDDGDWADIAGALAARRLYGELWSGDSD